MNNRKCSRREFIKKACFGAAVSPFILSAQRLHAALPNERITMACIGVGGQGGHDTNMFLADPRVQIVASCDVDLPRAKAMAARIEGQYSKETGSGKYKGCTITQDFRELIARKDIDAVMIATPDHTHAVIAVSAAHSGKHIYCEKPLSYCIAEGRAICNTVTQFGRVLQVGTQRRSVDIYRYGCELIRNGRIGKLQTVKCGPGKGFHVRGDYSGEQPPEPVPPDFNYDLWLGPAPWAPYTPGRCHFNFRWILDYGEGYISDNGVHFIDLASRGMGTDLTGPEYIDGKGTFPTSGLYNAPTEFDITYHYPNGVKLVLGSAEEFGVKFEGSEGWIHFHADARLTASSEKILTSTIGPNEIHLRSGSLHHADFIDCVLDHRLPAAYAEIGHRTASVCHLGYISVRLGRPLKWDPVREIFPDDPVANRMLSRAPRAPWTI